MKKVGLLAVVLAGMLWAAASTGPAYAQTWSLGTSSNWNNSGNWTPSVVPNSSGASVLITDNTSTVTLDINASVATLQLATGNTLNLASGTALTVYGPGIPTISNSGVIGLSGALGLAGNVTLSGPGVVTMTGNGQIGTNGNGYTLTNQSTIQGTGAIGINSTFYPNLNLNNTGTINANSNGQALTIESTGTSIVNGGLFEATNSGTLNLSTQYAIDNSGGNITANNGTVNVGTTIQGGTLNTSNGGVMQTTGAGATLDASSLGAITLSDGSTYTATAGTTKIQGTLNLGTVTGSTLALGGALELTGNTTLTGPGVVNISGNASNQTGGQIGTNGNGYTLTNQSTIQGSGTIGSNAITYQNLNLNNTGTINANSNGQALAITGTGTSIVNSGLFEATNGGILNLSTQAAINNSAGNITANGGTVNVGTTIQGGTLNTSNGGVMQTTAAGATLDASSLGAITLTDGSTYTATAGTTKIQGTLNLGTVTGSTLALGGALELTGDTTLTGPGVVTISGNASNQTGGQIGTNGNGYTLTNQSIIQGSGTIGSNSITYQNLNLNNTGTINANSNGQALAITGDGGTIVNGGLFEATNGGILNLSTQAAINNSTGNITANNGTVNVGTTIQGGTLNTSNGGVMQTAAAGATLDASGSHPITLSDGSTYTATAGLTSITGTLNLGTVTGSTLALGGQLQLVGDTTLSGPGMVSMTGNGQIGTNGNGYTLTNQNTIQGSGVIGSNIGALYQNLNLNNTGTINANINGQTLWITGNGGSIVNGGLFEATNGGTLNLWTQAAINNNGGNITANNGTVNINTTIQGGTLNTLNGGVMQTAAGGTAFLDASSQGPITLSDGSTYTATPGFTKITGMLNLGTVTGSTLAVGEQLQLVGDTTLSGPGVVNMSGDGQIGTNGNGYTLTNGSTIQGSGVIGSNIGALYQNLNLNNTGTINANITGQTLWIAGTGQVTNNGTFKATAGGTLGVTSHLTNFSGTTLSGGTYIVDGTGGASKMILAVGGGSGGEIVNNAANITLSGTNANVSFVDANGNQLLSALAANSTPSSGLTVKNGYAFSTPGDFANAGAVNVGAGSSFTTGPGGANSFTQTGSGASLTVNGTFTTTLATINDGILSGSGTVVGNVTVGP